MHVNDVVIDAGNMLDHILGCFPGEIGRDRDDRDGDEGE